MTIKDGYLVFDIGTGNARVAIITTSGEILALEREDIHYETEPLYPDSRYFSPDSLWEQLVQLAKKALESVPHVVIRAITSTSQRQGIVLLDEENHSFLGLPNIDNRGREWEQMLPDSELIFKTTGRSPSTLFSALKLVALKKKQPHLWDKLATFTSLSDWVTYKLSDVLVYEPSQATETLLYDVQKNDWSQVMCEQFGLTLDSLPELKWSGTILGHITSTMARELGLTNDVLIIVGGGDTQLAIESTFAKNNDVVIVSGTTTPICKIIDHCQVDHEKRAWTNSHTLKNRWLLETNPGITGLNYQKLKNIFYKNESYQQMEDELRELENFDCVSALGMYLSDEKNATKKGGFIFNVPLEQHLTRAHFVASALWEIACSIKWNFDQLGEVTSIESPYVWACGGGLQSETLAAFIANLLHKEVRIRQGFSQASVVGAAAICNQSLGLTDALSDEIKVISPDNRNVQVKYNDWLNGQHFFLEMNKNTSI